MVERVVVGPWKTNCYIFSSSKKECVIIDPGGDETEIASRVDVLSMVPIGIALTHGHVDHVAALGRLQASYASRGYKLPVAISAADRKYIGIGGLDIQRDILDQLGLDGRDLLAAAEEEFPRADVRLHDGDRVFDTDIVVLETPGHTAGSLCFYAEKEGILFSGDTLFFDGVGRSDLPGGSEKKLRESILKKIAVLPPETRVFPGHGPFTTVERERRGNPFLREPQPVKPPAPLQARPVGGGALRAHAAPPGQTRTAVPRPAASAPARAGAKTPAAARGPAHGSKPAKVRPARHAAPASRSKKGAIKGQGAAKQRAGRPASRAAAPRAASQRAVASRAASPRRPGKPPAKDLRRAGAKPHKPARAASKTSGSGKRPRR